MPTKRHRETRLSLQDPTPAANSIYIIADDSSTRSHVCVVLASKIHLSGKQVVSARSPLVTPITPRKI